MTLATKDIKRGIIELVLREQGLNGQLRPDLFPSSPLGIDFEGKTEAQVFLVALGLELARMYDRQAVLAFAWDAVINTSECGSSLHAPGWKVLES